MIDNTITEYTKTITDACTLTIPKKKTEEKLSVPRWSDELVTKKRKGASSPRNENPMCRSGPEGKGSTSVFGG